MKKQVVARRILAHVPVGIILFLIGLSFAVMNLGFSSYEKRMVEEGVVNYLAGTQSIDLSHSEEKVVAHYFRIRCAHNRIVEHKTDGDSKLEEGDKVRVSLVETYRRKYPWPFSFTWVYDSVRAEDVVFVERPKKEQVDLRCDDKSGWCIQYNTFTTESK